MSAAEQKRWCLFTSAGDNNAIRLWIEGGVRSRWDLVVAYYGDNDHEFSKITAASTYAFRTKGGKFQNLKKLVERDPHFFESYTYVWICDDDIQMSGAQIDEAFAITERFEFWVAQPAFRPGGKISLWITCYAGEHCDYRIVNYVEVTAPIFRKDKLLEFLAVYDGSLSGYGVDNWFVDFFKANDFGRFAIIDKVQVINPQDEEKGGREIDRLQSTPERRNAWMAVQKKYGLKEFPHRVLAYCKFASEQDGSTVSARPTYEFPPELHKIAMWLEAHRPVGWHDGVSFLRALADDVSWHLHIHLERGFPLIKDQRCNVIHRSSPPYVAIIQNLERFSPTAEEVSEEIQAIARSLKAESIPTFGVWYSAAGAITDVRFGRVQAR